MSDPFFKFCSPAQPHRRPNALMAGMYIPLDLWELFEASGVLEGPRGAAVVRFDNTPRWISNTLFAELVAGALLGTAGRASRHIAQLIRTSLGLEKSVVVGIEHPIEAPSQTSRAED